MVTFVLLALRQLSGELADPFGEANCGESPSVGCCPRCPSCHESLMQVGSFETKFEGPLEVEPSQELAFIPLRGTNQINSMYIIQPNFLLQKRPQLIPSFLEIDISPVFSPLRILTG